jgi:predicted RNA methylase
MAPSVHQVFVTGLLPWIDARRLLGPGDWVFEGRSARCSLPTHVAADLDARLHNVAIGGIAIAVTSQPTLPRPAVRAARTTDARRRRDTTPGFLRNGARLDDEGKVSLTPEALALEIGKRAWDSGARTVVDAGCGAGGNAIGFARAGLHVLAIERDAARLADARHNARLYGVEAQVRFVLGDAVALARVNTADMLFVDPPWGVNWARDGMGVADLAPLAEMVAIPGKYRTHMYKLPPSFRVAELADARATAIYGIALGDNRRVKFLLLTRYCASG